MKLSKQEEQVDREQLNEQIRRYSSENPILETSSLPHTAISLPRLNVVFESDKSSSDPTSSAKLVLSNLASGTLILSPVNASSSTSLLNAPSLMNSNVPSTSSLHKSAEPVQNEKTVEAAQALANLYASSQNRVESSGDDSRSVAVDFSRSSSLDNQSEYGETKGTQNLPHKLRFKSSHRESID